MIRNFLYNEIGNNGWKLDLGKGIFGLGIEFFKLLVILRYIRKYVY